MIFNRITLSRWTLSRQQNIIPFNIEIISIIILGKKKQSLSSIVKFSERKDNTITLSRMTLSRSVRGTFCIPFARNTN
jgi:hypothetical protein